MRRKQSRTIAPLIAVNDLKMSVSFSNAVIRYFTNLSLNDVGTKTLIFAGGGRGG
jgi:hypothetical protein